MNLSEKKVFEKVMDGLYGSKIDWDAIEDYVVLREFKNFDLCICKKEEGINDNIAADDLEYDIKKSAGEIVLILENKFKSIAYKAQLDNYEKKIREYNIEIFKKKITKKIEELESKKDARIKDLKDLCDKVESKIIKINKNRYEINKNCINKLEKVDYGKYQNAHKEYEKIETEISELKLNKKDIKEESPEYRILLSLATDFSAKQSIIQAGWKIGYYKCFSCILRQILNGVEKGFRYDLIDNYRSFIETFSSEITKDLKKIDLETTWDGIFGTNDLNSKYRNIRCYDIWQKLVMHKFNGELLQKLSDDNLNADPDSTDSYIKQLVEKVEKNQIKENALPLIYSGVQFLHGEGIIEVKYLVKDNNSYDYTICIQQQGCSLCVGVAFFRYRKNYISVSRPKKNEDAEEPNGKTSTAWSKWQEAIINFVNKHIKDKFSALPIKPDQEIRAYESENTGYYYQTFYLDKKSQPNLIPKKADKEGSQNSTTTQNNGNSTVGNTLNYMASVVNKIHEVLNPIAEEQ